MPSLHWVLLQLLGCLVLLMICPRLCYLGAFMNLFSKYYVLLGARQRTRH